MHLTPADVSTAPTRNPSSTAPYTPPTRHPFMYLALKPHVYPEACYESNTHSIPGHHIILLTPCCAVYAKSRADPQPEHLPPRTAPCVPAVRPPRTTPYTLIGSTRGNPQSIIMYRIQNIHNHLNGTTALHTDARVAKRTPPTQHISVIATRDKLQIDSIWKGEVTATAHEYLYLDRRRVRGSCYPRKTSYRQSLPGRLLAGEVTATACTPRQRVQIESNQAR